MTTPGDYPYSRVAELWGGTAGNTSGMDFTAACAGAQASAEGGERRRRDLASARPGLGAQMDLPKPYADAGQGSPPVVGEGYALTAGIASAVSKAYGPARPVYADDLVGGVGFRGGRSGPAVRHVTSLGDGRLFIEGASRP